MKNRKPLTLTRLTLHPLTAPELARAEGGLPPVYPTVVLPSDACPVATSH
jgi:hypothetical protein